MRLGALLVLVSSACWALAAGSAESCTSVDALASDVRVVLDPASPAIGQSYTLTTSYDLSEAITSGTVWYMVTMGGFPVVDERKPLCEELQGGDTPCPLEPGHVSSVVRGEVPSTMPHGQFDTVVRWATDGGREILCIKFSFVV